MLFLLIFLAIIIFPPTLNTENNGEFHLVFLKSNDRYYRDIETIVKDSGQFQNIIQGLNSEFLLPQNIMVEFSDREEGPLYNPEKQKITMGYAFMLNLLDLYLKKYPNASDTAIENFLIRSTTFLFYHEMAHALIDTLNLPIVSNEETAADDLAVIIALEYTNDGYNITMDSAELFDLFDQTKKTYQEDDLWDEHALDSQRFYNIICLTYGKYPQEVVSELKNKKVLEFLHTKGDFCKQEYLHQVQSWLKLLNPYFREN